MEKDSLHRAIEELFKEVPLSFSEWIEQFDFPAKSSLGFSSWQSVMGESMRPKRQSLLNQLKKEGQMRVEAYTKHHAKYVFTARNKEHAREIANRIITEGLWVTDDEGADKGTEIFFPVHQVFKVKVILK